MSRDALSKIASSALPVSALDVYFGPRFRYWTSKIFGAIALFFLLINSILFIGATTLPSMFIIPFGSILSLIASLPGVDLANTTSFSIPLLPGVGFVTLHLSRALGVWNGVMLLALSLYLLIRMLNAFARSKYYQDIASVERSNEIKVSFVVSDICARAKHGDLLQSFIRSKVGTVIFERMGFTGERYSDFILHRTEITDYRNDQRLSSVHDILDLVRLLSEDKYLLSYFESHAVSPDDFVAAAEWVLETDERVRASERVWGLQALNSLTPIGGDIAHGRGYILRNHAIELDASEILRSRRVAEKEVQRLKQAFLRDRSANALLVAPNKKIAEEIVLFFAHDLERGINVQYLQDKRCHLFDVQSFLRQISSAIELEELLSRILDDAVAVGNVIFVVNDLPTLFRRAEQFGADLGGILRPYLSGDFLQVIAISDIAEYQEVLSAQPVFAEYFHDIHIQEFDESDLLARLEVDVERIEAKHDIFFTVPALREVIRDAGRTMVHGMLSDKAEEILEGIAAFAREKKVKYILPSDIDEYVSRNSPVPIGRALDSEKERLLNIESILHESVIGQDVAIRAIGDALRRIRAGVRNEKRPAASFFFFGPTGVGKTEAAKALARTFFSGEDKMVRFDMSEFADTSAVARLIGSMHGDIGVLSSSVREHPYGVLLLDEFEKADKAVHDLFLQILDEGVFHDAQGHVVNCRNLMIIATSNVGATEIYDKMRSGQHIDEDFTRILLDHILSAGALRPELINRFDKSILFTPIDEAGYRAIAKLMLKKLSSRLQKEGIVLVINDELVEAIMKKGVDPVFGARPMQRAIQDIIEKRVAEKILQGKTGLGVPLTFTEEELK